MKSVLLGLCCVTLIALGAWLITSEVGTSSAERFTSSNGSVRIDVDG